MHSPWAHHDPLVNQATPSKRLVDLYFPADAPGFTLQNFSRILFHARSTSRGLNGQFLLSPLQLFFGSGNAALSVSVVGGETRHLRDWFGADGYEKFPEGWEPICKDSLGIVTTCLQIPVSAVIRNPSRTALTMFCTSQNISAAQGATWQVELGVGRVSGPRMTGWATSEDGWQLAMADKKLA